MSRCWVVSHPLRIQDGERCVDECVNLSCVCMTMYCVTGAVQEKRSPVQGEGNTGFPWDPCCIKILAQPLQSSPATRRVYRKEGAPPEGLSLPGLLPPLPRPVFFAVVYNNIDKRPRCDRFIYLGCSSDAATTNTLSYE